MTLLTPAQEEVLALLRETDLPRPEVPPNLRDDLRAELEAGVRELAAGLDRPLFVGKAALGRVLACEAHHLDEESAPFEWSVATARGTVAHRAIELSVHRRDDPSPLRLVDDALDRLADDPQERMADWLLGLPESERAELRSSVNELVATFLELWPPLQASWRPQTESPRRVELAGGMVILSGRVDLTLGAPRGLRAGRVIVDLKTGRRYAHHQDDLRFYALLDTLRSGVPPFSLVGYELDAGRFTVEPVTEATLESAVRRTLGAVHKLLELRLGLRSPAATPAPTCGWCRLRPTCEVARTRDDDRFQD